MNTIESIKELRLKKIDNLIESANEAGKRVRQIFVFTLVGSVVVFVAVFNTYFSWMRHVNPKERYSYPVTHDFFLDLEKNASNHLYDPYFNHAFIHSKKGLDISDSCKCHICDTKSNCVIGSQVDVNKALAQHTFDKLIDNYFERQSVNIPILGIKVSTHDLPLLGSVCTIVFLVWLFFANRREFRVINEIKLEHSIGPNWIDDKDPQYKELELKLKDYILQSTIHKFIFLSSTRFTSNTKRYKSGMELFFLKLLFYTPVIVLVFLIAGEAHSIINNPSLFSNYFEEQCLRYAILLLNMIISFLIIKDIRYQSKDSENIFAQMQDINTKLKEELAKDNPVV